jgi:hypothetical protein
MNWVLVNMGTKLKHETLIWGNVGITKMLEKCRKIVYQANLNWDCNIMITEKFSGMI